MTAERELILLREVAITAKVYFDNYLQDEASEIECCVCGEEQFRRAGALRDALSALEASIKMKDTK